MDINLVSDFVKTFVNPYVLGYLLAVGLGQLGYTAWKRVQRNAVATRRRRQGLPDDLMLSTAQTLAEHRRDALLASAILLLTVTVLPFLLIHLSAYGENEEARNGISIVFAGLVLWMLLIGTDVAKSLLGGLAFRTIVAFQRPAPFQTGDRVTLKGIGGKVIGFDSFFVTLQTPNDDQVSIPTASLWSEVLSSVNAGERASLCVMHFYLAPFVTAEQRDAAEDAIWDAIQSSPYYTPSKPMNIFLGQTPDSIQLTAKAYVASTHNEVVFISDVTRVFLDFASHESIALASSAWRMNVEAPRQLSEA